MRLVALIAVLALVSTAGATEQVWFQAAGATVQGAPGVTLVLPQGGTYTVDMYLQAPGSLTGFDIALQGAATGSALVQYGCGAAGWATDFATVGTSPVVWYAQSGASFWTSATPVKLATFTLTIGNNVGLVGGASADGQGWGSSSGAEPPIQFGAYFNAGGDPDSWASGPAIQTLVPEPTTLVLFGLGLVGLLRRR